MRFTESFESLCCHIASMGREEVTRQIIDFRGRIKLDFTESYLSTLSIDKLRHILMAAVMVDGEKSVH